jgi:hypothetical protein
MKKWEMFKKICEKMHYFFTFKDFVFISDKPTEMHFKNALLHNESGPSVLYKDGYSLWNLNGVRVPKELVMTPWNKLDSKIILTEKNADVRREIVRKVGIERVCSELKAKSVDSLGVYELLMLDIGDNRVRPYLKMKNPSIGTYHIEGVHPSCTSVESALNWRNGTTETPHVLT